MSDAAFTCDTQWQADRIMWNSTVLTIVEHNHRFATWQLSLSVIPTYQPSFTLGWCMATFCKWIVMAGRGNLWQLYSTKTSCSFHCICLKNIIPRMLLVRAKYPEQLLCENNTSRNHTSVIIQYLCRWFFGARKNERCLKESKKYGNSE
jgi:hypothetical protein